jgi:hypothetical protein
MRLVRLVATLALPVCLAAALAPGCLITQAPQFPELHTAPLLVSSTAYPPPWELVIVDVSNPQTLTFQAEVISQDDQSGSSGAFTTITPKLLFDYGITVQGEPPYRPPAISGYPLSAGSFDETGRMVSVEWSQAQWTSGPYSLPFGCNTVTLMVSHIWDPVLGCPECADDVSSITWPVFVCDMSQPGNCDDISVATCPLTSASPAFNSCAAYMLAQDAGAECPEGDGGS